MIEVSYQAFRDKLKELLNKVADKNEPLLVKRKSGKNVVMISLIEYNSIMETFHLLGSGKNAARLFESIRQMNFLKQSKLNLRINMGFIYPGN